MTFVFFSYQLPKISRDKEHGDVGLLAYIHLLLGSLHSLSVTCPIPALTPTVSLGVTTKSLQMSPVHIHTQRVITYGEHAVLNPDDHHVTSNMHIYMSPSILELIISKLCRERERESSCPLT